MKMKIVTTLALMIASLTVVAAPLEKQMTFSVWLKLRHQRELARLAQEVYDQHSPRYHQFLTPAVFDKKFAPDKQAVAAVQQYFIAAGLRAQNINHHLVVTGTQAQIERALHTKILDTTHIKSHLTASLDADVAGITGLSVATQRTAEPVNYQRNNHDVHNLNFSWKNFTPDALPTDLSLQGFTGANLRKTYSVNNIPLINGKRIDGAGQTLVIVDKCGTNSTEDILSNANTYFNENHIRPFIPTGPDRNFSVINSDGTPFTKCPNATSYSQEIMLDIESSHTIAPGDNTVLVLGQDQKTILMDVISTLTTTNFTIAGFPNAYVISNSWSGPESATPDTLLESWLSAAAAHGISVNFSSGDCGDNTYTTTKKCHGTWPSSPKVDYPSSSAYVTAVGATAVFVDNQYRYAFETVWGAVKNLAYDGGTGGGISRHYGPVTWQSSISTFSAGGYGLISSHASRRALPDIAMLGDPKTGLIIYSNNSHVQDGGTSLACPLFSATLLLVNQSRVLLNKSTPIGQAAPYLYQMNDTLRSAHALNLIVPPAVIISGATPPPSGVIQANTAPASSFTIHNDTYGWDSSLTVEPEQQFWNDAIGVGSPNIPNFVMTMAGF